MDINNPLGLIGNQGNFGKYSKRELIDFVNQIEDQVSAWNTLEEAKQKLLPKLDYGGMTKLKFIREIVDIAIFQTFIMDSLIPKNDGWTEEMHFWRPVGDYLSTKSFTKLKKNRFPGDESEKAVNLKDELLLEILEHEENRIKEMDEKVVKFKKKDFTPLFEKLLTTNPRFDDTEKKIMKDKNFKTYRNQFMKSKGMYDRFDECFRILKEKGQLIYSEFEDLNNPPSKYYLKVLKKSFNYRCSNPRGSYFDRIPERMKYGIKKIQDGGRRVDAFTLR